MTAMLRCEECARGRRVAGRLDGNGSGMSVAIGTSMADARRKMQESETSSSRGIMGISWGNAYVFPDDLF